MSYPAVLLPQPTYRLLLPTDVLAGLLLRRTRQPVRINPAADGRPVLADPTQLCDIPSHFGMGFSVNLAGQFEPNHAGWALVPGNPDAVDKIREPWLPPTPVTAPTTAEMDYLPPTAWGVLVLQLEALHGRWFRAATFGEWQAIAMHAPNCWNYWHYEVRFRNQAEQWLHQYKQHDPRVLTNRNWELACEGLLQSFQEAGLALPLATELPAAPWPQTLFDTAAVTAQP